MNILETIIAQKKKEVADKKERISIDSLKSQSGFERETISLRQHLYNGQPNIIAEFKRKSPSKGWIHENANITDIVSQYAIHGAAAVSVLTDKEFFGGDIEELKTARDEVYIPILRKDFMIDEYQLYEAKSYGADVILLIAACLSKKRVQELAQKAKEFNLDVLLEIHSENEIECICDEVDIIGVNNRNLATFVTDIRTSVDLIKSLPANKPLISESGIADVDTIMMLHELGYKGFLIGETFMKSERPAIAFAEFMKALNGKLIQY
jgi:indole-3-glycerol phosphate synthase